MDEIADLLVFLIPIYVANAIPVVLGGGAPLDLSTKFVDGRRVLGESKTIRGFIAGVAGGTTIAGIISMFYLLPFFPDASTQFMAGFAMSLGTMLGDAFGSFMKRRAGMEPGKPFILDTMLFVVFALILAYPFVTGTLYDPANIAFILLLTVILHPLTNFLANQTGLKKVPW
ncbi:MAG: CDP-2,3-bis-(O-geranylgeranyl)-sn-glycerol synthase [Candidatus Micrarchaeota archaeon]